MDNLGGVLQFVITTIIPELILWAISTFIKFLSNRSVWFARFRDRKNWKIIDDIVVGRIRDEDPRKFHRNTVHYWLQLAFIYIMLSILLFFCILGEITVRLITQETVRPINWLILWTILIGNIVITSLIAKRKKIKWYVWGAVEGIYIFILSVGFIKDLKAFLCLAGIATFMEIIIFQLFLENIVFKKCYKNTYIKISEFVRYAGLLLVIPISLEAQTGLKYCPYIWMLIVTVEYVIMILEDQSDRVGTMICFGNYSVKTREAIAVCHGERLLYISEDGIHKFEDIKNVKYIHYELKNRYKTINFFHTIHCILIDGQEKNYDGYTCCGKEWIAFRRTEEAMRKIDIYHLSQIKEFTKEDSYKVSNRDENCSDIVK